MKRYDRYYSEMEEVYDGDWVKYDDMYAALQAYETQLAESKVSLESANAEIADLKATEKVYHMNRDWIANAKIKIASLEDELSKVPMRFSSYINMATHCDTMSQLQREAADALRERDSQITQLQSENKKLTEQLESANAEIAILKAKIELQRENSIASSAHHEANFGHLKTHYEFKNKKLADENAEISAENVRLRAALEKIKWLGNESRKHSLPDLKMYRCPTCDSAEIAHEALEKLK